MTNVVRPFIRNESPSWMSASDSESRLDVASSRMRIRGSARIARAIETRWRCPPDSFTPRSPTIVSYFFSKPSANSSTRAIRQARRISSSPASGRENATFSRIVPSKRNVSCRTTPSADRYESSRTVERSTPSMRATPPVGTWNAATRPMIVDLPEPEGPTRAVTVPGGAWKETPWRTSFPSSYANFTSSNTMSPDDRGKGRPCGADRSPRAFRPGSRASSRGRRAPP